MNLKKCAYMWDIRRQIVSPSVSGVTWFTERQTDRRTDKTHNAA